MHAYLLVLPVNYIFYRCGSLLYIQISQLNRLIKVDLLHLSFFSYNLFLLNDQLFVLLSLHVFDFYIVLPVVNFTLHLYFVPLEGHMNIFLLVV